MNIVHVHLPYKVFKICAFIIPYNYTVHSAISPYCIALLWLYTQTVFASGIILMIDAYVSSIAILAI